MNNIPMPGPISEEQYTIAFDPGPKIIRIVLRGFWTPEIMTSYLDALDQFNAASCQHFGIARLLVDRRESPVQSAEVHKVAEMRYGVVEANHRLAMVTESSLAQMQMRLGIQLEHMRFFTDPAEAEAWLLQE